MRRYTLLCGIEIAVPDGTDADAGDILQGILDGLGQEWHEGHQVEGEPFIVSGKHAATMREHSMTAGADDAIALLRMVWREFDQTYDASCEEGTWQAGASICADFMDRAGALLDRLGAK